MLQGFGQLQGIPHTEAVIEVAALHGSSRFAEVAGKGEAGAAPDVTAELIAQGLGLFVNRQRTVNFPCESRPTSR